MEKIERERERIKKENERETLDPASRSSNEKERVHESTRAPPKYAFRPKDPHFAIDPHDFLFRLHSNRRNLRARVLSHLWLGPCFSRPRSSNRTGSARTPLAKGRRWERTGWGKSRIGWNTRGRRRRQKLPYSLAVFISSRYFYCRLFVTRVSSRAESPSIFIVVVFRSLSFRSVFRERKFHFYWIIVVPNDRVLLSSNGGAADAPLRYQ